jgi:Tfp pilus assembly protein PilF
MNEGMFKAKAAALKALELDDSLAEAHTSLAQISSTYERNWALAESEYKRAIALNANYSTGHHYYATFLMAMGRHDEAMAEMKKAQELDPLSPIIATFIGKALYFAGKNDEYIAEYQKVLATDPAFPVARVSCLSWNWRRRSSVKITERTYEKRAKALHWRREGCHPEATFVG